MTHIEKLRQLLFSDDLETIKQGISLMDSLCDTIEEICVVLEKPFQTQSKLGNNNLYMTIKNQILNISIYGFWVRWLKKEYLGP